MDARRSIGLLIGVAGNAVVGVGIAASPSSFSLALGSNYGAFVGAALVGAAIGGYLRHRGSDPGRAPLWALAYGASVAALFVAMVGTAVVIGPTVRGIPALEGAWAGLILSGYLVVFPGVLLWERDTRRRRFAALAYLALMLVLGGILASMSGDPWASLGAPVSVSGIGVLLFAFVAGRPFSDHGGAEPVTWH